MEARPGKMPIFGGRQRCKYADCCPLLVRLVVSTLAAQESRVRALCIGAMIQKPVQSIQNRFSVWSFRSLYLQDWPPLSGPVHAKFHTSLVLAYP